MTIHIGILGNTGRVGKLLTEELKSDNWPKLSLAGGTNRKSSQDEIEMLFEKADLLIDFSAPDATAKHIWLAAKAHKPIVVATTGLSQAQESEIKDAAKETAILYAANTSIGVTLLQNLVEQAAKVLGPEYDIEILETHHKHKVDAPSGTALALGKAAARGRGVEAPSPTTDRAGAREDDTIGFAVRRGGDVAGEHTVSFYGEGERIEISHTATNRILFARGALKAALWLNKKPDGLYSMHDVLDL